MIEPEFEIQILIKNEFNDDPVPAPALLCFNDIEHFYMRTYLGREITVMAMISGETIMANFPYETFKKKYRDRKAEIINSMGNRP